MESLNQDEILWDIIAFIEEKAESRGWENAECMAEDRWGKDLVERAIALRSVTDEDE